jgi:hypothetical protein
MARLLRDSEHEDNDARMGQVASTSLQKLYLETVEETQDQSEQLDATGNTGMASMGGE